MTIRAVLFDLDDTLLDRRATFRRHLQLQIERHRQLFRRGDPEDYVAELLALDENGTLDRSEFYRRAEVQFGLPAGAARVLRSDFKTHFPEQCIPFRDMIATLTRLRAMDLKLAIVTNGSVRTQTRKIDRLGICRLLDCVVISEAVGVHKPDRRIFDVALRELGVSATEAVFVGDNPAVDIAGAKQASMYAIWKRDDFWSAPQGADLVISELCELPARLEALSVSA